MGFARETAGINVTWAAWHLLPTRWPAWSTMSWTTISHISQENVLLAMSIGHGYVSVRYAYAKLLQEHHSDLEVVLRLWSQCRHQPIKCSNHICVFMCICPHCGHKSLASHRSPKVPGNSAMKFSSLIFTAFWPLDFSPAVKTKYYCDFFPQCLYLCRCSWEGNGLQGGLVQAVWSTLDISSISPALS